MFKTKTNKKIWPLDRKNKSIGTVPEKAQALNFFRERLQINYLKYLDELEKTISKKLKEIMRMIFHRTEYQ